MIRTIDIRLNAAHPELPLPEATTYQGAPSTAFLRGVPKSCGQWQITAVSVAVTFPDNSTTTCAAVLSAGDVWVVTIPACATSGRTVSGLRILADGIDENGDAVTGYVLGVADFAVATFDIAPAPGVTSYTMRYFDNVPNPPHKVDVAKIGGVLKYYDGAAWQVFADVDLSDYATKADATLEERGFSEWTIAPSSITYDGQTYQSSYYKPQFGDVEGRGDEWFHQTPDYYETLNSTDPDATSFTYTFGGRSVTATRTALSGYQLGSQSDKPLASEAEAEALRTEVAAKYEKPTGGIPATDLAAAVQTSLGKADAALPASEPNGGAIGWASHQLSIVGADLYVSSVYTSTLHPDIDKTVTIPSANGTLALAADLRYALGAEITASATLADRTINKVTQSGATDIALAFPAAVSGKARDFLVLVSMGASATGAITFTTPSGATVYGDGFSGAIAAGETWLYSITEIAANEWLVKRQEMEVAL